MKRLFEMARQVLPLILGTLFVTTGLGGNEKDVAAEDGLEKYQKLTDRNPFVPKSQKPKMLMKAADSEYIFAGFMVMGDLVRVGIEDKRRGKSYLLEQGESEDGIVVKEIDLEKQRVVFAANGNTISLNISPPSSGTGQPVRIIPPAPAAPVASPPAGTQAPTASAGFGAAADVATAANVAPAPLAAPADASAWSVAPSTTATAQPVEGPRRRTIVVPKRTDS